MGKQEFIRALFMKKYEFIDHTADIALKVYGAKLDELFVNAFYGFREAVAEYSGEPECKRVTFVIDEDRADFLLVEFLSQINFQMLTEKIIPYELNSLKLYVENDKINLICEVDFAQYDEANISILEEIKAVTYHDLEIKQTETGFESVIVLDI